MMKNQKRALDKSWKIKVIELAGGRCSFPGCNKEAVDAHHVRKCRYLNTRWDIDNGRALCREDHRWVEEHPTEYKFIIIKEIGIYEYEQLRKKSLEVIKQDYDELKERLQ